MINGLNTMTDNILRWGIIGCGDVTEKKSGPAFRKIGGSALTAVMRRDAARARDYAERHGVPVWYDDAHALINDPGVDAIYIATPPDAHEELAIAAMSAGKPVYVEKPMATTVAACERMREVSENTGMKLSIAHYRRAVPMFAQIRSWIDGGEIGTIRTVRISMLQADRPESLEDPRIRWRVTPESGGPGGHFYDLAPHQLDLMLHFFGKVTAFQGFGINQAGSYPARDAVCGSIVFDNGILFTGQWAFTVNEAHAEDVCEIQGTTGKLVFQFFGNRVEITRQGVKMAVNFEHPDHIQQPMIEQVTAYFKGIGDNPCSAEDAIASMRIMEAFIQQA
ncbi:MAG: Gfo/Idh/MocA family protein [bacterium]